MIYHGLRRGREGDAVAMKMLRKFGLAGAVAHVDRLLINMQPFSLPVDVRGRIMRDRRAGPIAQLVRAPGS